MTRRPSVTLSASRIQKNVDRFLANASAPVGYLTRKHLPATDDAATGMKSLWREVENSPCVQEMFGKQEANDAWHAGGSWAHAPSYAVKGGVNPYRPKYVTTVWILPLLGEMGYSVRDRRVLKARRFAVSHGYFLDPRFSGPIDEIRQGPIDLCRCRFAQYMLAFGAVNFVDDPRVEKGYEMVMFSELGLGLRTRAVRTILKWLVTLYDAEHGCFTYAGKPVSKYSNKEDGIDSRVAKYRLYHVIEDDWLTCHMTRIAANMLATR